MLSAIVAASCSTANGVILGTACVAVRNIAGLEQQADPAGGRDPLLRRVRITMPLVVGIAIFFALRVPQTGILLTLAFDLMLAGLRRAVRARPLLVADHHRGGRGVDRRRRDACGSCCSR